MKIYNIDKIKTKFWKDGFVHIKSVFMEKDIEKLRAFIIKNEKKKILKEIVDKDIFNNTKINKYFLDDRVVKIIKAILEKPPVYFGDSSITIVKQHNVGMYHKDCTDRLDPNGPDWKSKYPLIRVALFLQDHKKSSGGIILGKFSHNILFKSRLIQVFYEEIFGFLSGTFKHCDSKMGDLVIWNLRTTHGPMGKRLKYFFKRPISRRLDKFIPNFLKYTFYGSRILVTATFGSESQHLTRYINYLKTRKYMVNKWIKSSCGRNIKKIFNSKDIIFYDLKKDVKKEYKEKKITPVDAWKPYPY